MQISALRSCPRKSERIQAVSNRSVSLRKQKFRFWEFLIVVLTCRLLPGGAVLREVSGVKRLETGA